MRTLGLVAVLAGCGRLAFVAQRDSGASGGDGSDTTCGAFGDPSASAFGDNFTSGSLTPGWDIVNGSCVDESGGELVSTPPSNMSGSYCFVWTHGVYHLSCDSIVVRVPEVTQPVLGAQTFIYLEPADQSQQYALILEDGGFNSHLNGTGDFFPYDAASDAWWRLSEAAGQLIFSVSPDGATWTTVDSGPDPFPLDNINVGLGAGTYVPVADPGQAVFHCYNVPPPCS